MIDIGNISATQTSSNRKNRSWLDFLQRDIQFGSKRLNDKRKERFYSELHTLLISGVDIRTAFELLEAEAERKEEKSLYVSILNSIVSGATLPDAIRATKLFSDYEYFSLRIGEESGRMNAVLQDLTNYYHKKIRQQRRVKSALTYPIVVITVAILAVVFMLRFVVPMFADMLHRFGTELPVVTQAVIKASDALGKYGPWLLLFFVAGITTIWQQRHREWFRRISSTVIVRIPFIGKITRKVYVERFAHAMHLLLVARTNLPEALQLVQKMVAFYPIEKSLDQVRQDILKGIPLHESLSRSGVYPRRMISLLRVAEEVNQLDSMFDKISKQLSDEIEHETSLLGSVIEPLMILFLGILVAVILVAMYLPMFKLGTTAA